MVPKGVKRVSVLILVGIVGTLVADGFYRCPFWQAGCPCPSCGLTRAIGSLVHGDLSQAFINNLIFPYWLFIGGGVTAGLVAYGLGLVDDPDLIGQRTISAIPVRAHALAVVISFLANVHHYGFNPSGWLWRLYSV